MSILLYVHPDGDSVVEFNKDKNCIVASGVTTDDEEDLESIYIQIGPVGLVELGNKLILLGKSP